MSISNPDSHTKNSAKRPRHSSPPLPGTLDASLESQGAPPLTEWSSKVRLFAHKTRLMWEDICDVDMPREWSPSIREDYDAALLIVDQIAAVIRADFERLPTIYNLEVSPSGQVTPHPGDTQPDTPNAPALDIPPPPKTYARAVGPRRRAPQANPKPQPKKATPVLPKSPVRAVLQLQGHDSIPARNLPPPELFQQLTEAIAASPNARDTKLMGTQWNKKGNLVLAFSPGTSRTSIRSTLPAIFSVFQLADKPAVIFDVPWAKVHLANIPARQHTDAPLFSEDFLQQSLALNPAIQDLRITRPARWIRKPDFIAGMRTSAVLTFEDPDGSLVRALLKTPIFAFGTPVTVKKWQDKPPVRRKGSGII